MKIKTNFPPEYPKVNKTPPYGDDDIPSIDLPQPKRGPSDVPEELQIHKEETINKGKL